MAAVGIIYDTTYSSLAKFTAITPRNFERSHFMSRFVDISSQSIIYSQPLHRSVISRLVFQRLSAEIIIANRLAELRHLLSVKFPR